MSAISTTRDQAKRTWSYDVHTTSPERLSRMHIAPGRKPANASLCFSWALLLGSRNCTSRTTKFICFCSHIRWGFRSTNGSVSRQTNPNRCCGSLADGVRVRCGFYFPREPQRRVKRLWPFPPTACREVRPFRRGAAMPGIGRTYVGPSVAGSPASAALRIFLSVAGPHSTGTCFRSQ